MKFLDSVLANYAESYNDGRTEYPRFFSERIRHIYREQLRKKYSARRITLKLSSCQPTTSNQRTYPRKLRYVTFNPLDLYLSELYLREVQSYVERERSTLKQRYGYAIRRIKQSLLNNDANAEIWRSIAMEMARQYHEEKRWLSKIAGKIRGVAAALSQLHQTLDKRIAYRNKHQVVFKQFDDEDSLNVNKVSVGHL